MSSALGSSGAARTVCQKRIPIRLTRGMDAKGILSQHFPSNRSPCPLRYQSTAIVLSTSKVAVASAERRAASCHAPPVRIARAIVTAPAVSATRLRARRSRSERLPSSSPEMTRTSPRCAPTFLALSVGQLDLSDAAAAGDVHLQGSLETVRRLFAAFAVTCRDYIVAS